jgi:Isoprenylcysteine carboxyl methyltransferase (ICMT) family
MRVALVGWEAVLRRDGSKCRVATGWAAWLQGSRRPVIGALYPIAGNRVLIALAATPKLSQAARYSMIACAGRAVLNQVDPGGRIGRTSPQATRRLSPGLHRPQGVLDLRRRHRSLAGVLLFAAGGALRIWPVFVLGHRFSGLVAIQPGHQLVTSGVYRVIRHPSYLGLLVNALGWALAFRSAVGVLLTALLLPPLLARIRSEEKMLRTQFGPEYDAYRSRTARLLPGLY